MVRGGQILVVMLVLASSLGVLAQSGGTDNQVTSDPSGDAFDLFGFELPDPVEQRVAAMDLVGLTIHEDEEQLRFHVQVAEISPESQTPLFGEGTVQVAFALGDATVTYTPTSYRPGEDTVYGDPVTVNRDRFRIDMHHEDGFATARLMQYDISRGEYVPAYESCPNGHCINQVDIDTENDEWVIHIPRVQLQDANARMPSHQVPLHSFLITSEANANDMGSVLLSSEMLEVRDIMPDDGIPAGQFVSQLGANAQVGHLRLQSDVPMRWSNGGVTEYVYQIQVANNRDTSDTVSLDLTDVPMGWNVILGAESLSLDANTSVDIPVRLSTQTLHRHGSFETFTVHAYSADDPTALGSVELGLRYSDVPQPAGHHPRLWIHAANASDGDDQETEPDPSAVPGSEGPREAQDSFMSTVPPEDQAGSDPDAVILYDQAFEPYLEDEFIYMWIIDLAPSLKMGLDFDLNRTGTVEIPFIASGQARLEGDLYIRAPSEQPLRPENVDEAQRLGTFRSTETVNFNPDRPSIAHATFQPLEKGDYVPFRPEGAHVYLVVELTFARGDQDTMQSGPWMVPGAKLDLPLNEYHDPSDGVAGPVNDIDVEVLGKERRMGNTDEAVLFDFRLTNAGVANERLQIQANSIGADWVTILGEDVVDVPSDGTYDFQALVSIPPEKPQGLVVGPVIEAVSLIDPHAKGGTRVFVEVDDLNDHPDYSDLLPAEETSLIDDPSLDANGEEVGAPALGPATSVLVLGLAMAALRRTRRL